jgi:Flp pilus assembly protein TadG
MIKQPQSTRNRRDRGAALVEFAVVVPLFLLLVFGVIEAGWFFAQEVELRNAAREGARLAVVDFGSGQEIRDETCSRADLSGNGATVTIVLNGPNDPTFDPPSASSITVTMSKSYQSITGMLDFAFGAATMSSSAEMRTERPLVSLTTNSTGICP